MLLPDYDFLRCKHYRDPAFEDTAPFVQRRRMDHARDGPGASRAAPARRHALPPLAIRALDIAPPPMGWPEMNRYRYLLSMDGNGAACSRLVLALRSQGMPVT